MGYTEKNWTVVSLHKANLETPKDLEDVVIPTLAPSQCVRMG